MSVIFTLLILALFGGVAWAYFDYRAWLALGVGGLPSNLRGWFTTTQLRLRKSDPFTTGFYGLADSDPDNIAYLADLPERNGPRPQIAPWPIPHRQLNQFVGTQMREKLNAVFDAAVARHGDAVHYKLSYFEKHHPAITMLQPDCCHRHADFGAGETAHIHMRDGSMHMILSEKDATRAIEAGWGERHPIAGVVPLLPDTYLYIYPPRDDTELAVVTRLVEAAILHMKKAPHSAHATEPAPRSP